MNYRFLQSPSTMCPSLLLIACFSLTIFLFNVNLDLEFDFELKLSSDLLVFLEYMLQGTVSIQFRPSSMFYNLRAIVFDTPMLACVPVITIVAEEANKIVCVYDHCTVRFLAFSPITGQVSLLI